MKPGQELDNLIAEKILGCSIEKSYREFGLPGERWVCNCVKDTHNTNTRFPNYHIKNYSTDIVYAMEVVEKIGYRFALIKERDGTTERPYKAFFSIGDEGFPVAYADTAAHAICLAAIKTLDLGDFT